MTNVEVASKVSIVTDLVLDGESFRRVTVEITMNAINLENLAGEIDDMLFRYAGSWMRQGATVSIGATRD